MATITREITFEVWMEQADVYCITKYGVSAHDLDDYLWRDAYDRGQLPTTAARAAYKNSGG